MSTLSSGEARRQHAKKHARQTRTCSICGKVCRGNGGWSSHKAMHLRRAGLPAKHNWSMFVEHVKRGEVDDESIRQ